MAADRTPSRAEMRAAAKRCATLLWPAEWAQALGFPAPPARAVQDALPLAAAAVGTAGEGVA